MVRADSRMWHLSDNSKLLRELTMWLPEEKCSRNSQCKGPRPGAYFVYARNSEWARSEVNGRQLSGRESSRRTSVFTLRWSIIGGIWRKEWLDLALQVLKNLVLKDCTGYYSENRLVGINKSRETSEETFCSNPDESWWWLRLDWWQWREWEMVR